MIETQFQWSFFFCRYLRRMSRLRFLVKFFLKLALALNKIDKANRTKDGVSLFQARQSKQSGLKIVA